MKSYLLSTDSGVIASELRELLEELVGRVVFEVVHEDGRLVQSRFQRQPYDLAFIPCVLRRMEVLTLLRAVGPEVASKIILLTPDTTDGFRTAWEGMKLGARDLLPTKGTPPQRLKGHHDLHLRHLAWHLEDVHYPEEHSFPFAEDLTADGPIVCLPETRHLVDLHDWVSQLPRTRSVVVRVPEGARLCRVLSDEWARSLAWPVRPLLDGDTLTPGHLHLFSEPEVLQILGDQNRLTARVGSGTSAVGSRRAREELWKALALSGPSFDLLAGDSLEVEDVELLGPRGIVHSMEEPTGRSESHAA